METLLDLAMIAGICTPVIAAGARYENWRLGRGTNRATGMHDDEQPPTLEELTADVRHLMTAILRLLDGHENLRRRLHHIENRVNSEGIPPNVN